MRLHVACPVDGAGRSSLALGDSWSYAQGPAAAAQRHIQQGPLAPRQMVMLARQETFEAPPLGSGEPIRPGRAAKRLGRSQPTKAGRRRTSFGDAHSGSFVPERRSPGGSDAAVSPLLTPGEARARGLRERRPPGIVASVRSTAPRRTCPVSGLSAGGRRAPAARAATQLHRPITRRNHPAGATDAAPGR